MRRLRHCSGWALNIGARDASRAPNLHVRDRSEAAGLGNPRSFELPFTQLQVAEATSLTAVHVNRTLSALDRDDAIVRRRNSSACSIGTASAILPISTRRMPS